MIASSLAVPFGCALDWSVMDDGSRSGARRRTGSENVEEELASRGRAPTRRDAARRIGDEARRQECVVVADREHRVGAEHADVALVHDVARELGRDAKVRRGRSAHRRREQLEFGQVGRGEVEVHDAVVHTPKSFAALTTDVYSVSNVKTSDAVSDVPVSMSEIADVSRYDTVSIASEKEREHAVVEVELEARSTGTDLLRGAVGDRREGVAVEHREVAHGVGREREVRVRRQTARLVMDAAWRAPTGERHDDVAPVGRRRRRRRQRERRRRHERLAGLKRHARAVEQFASTGSSRSGA